MALSDSSALSSPPSSDSEEEPPKAPVAPKTLKLKGGKLTAASSSPDASPLSSPEPQPPPREPTPPHEYVLADNPDIPFLVMFRSRFNEAFPKNVPNLGPQDIENGVVGSQPSEQMENLLCALLGLVLNRKKYVERGPHGRALEEAISTQKHQWPRSWGGANPLPGTRTFTDMDPTERLTLLKTLVLWALNTSDVISGILKESYKQARHDDDLNQPLSVQPWGNDGRKRKYWLIEGQNDTPFRLYKENAPKLVHRTWWSIAENLDELTAVGEDLRGENSQAGRRLADRIGAAIPRLEETLEKRKRKEYRQNRRAAFARPEPGYSLYEGRTRGRRMKYTFSDDEDTSDANSVRRSTRPSNRSTPGEFGGPTVTASGRQVRSRFGRSYGDPIQNSSEAENSNQADGELSNHASGRPRRATANGFHKTAGSGSNTDDEMSDGDDEGAVSSGEEWGGNDDDIEGKLDDDEEEEEEISDGGSDDSLMDHSGSLIVTLKYRKELGGITNQATDVNGSSQTGPSTFVAQNPSFVHRPQSSSSQNPNLSPSRPTPQDSQSTTLSMSHQSTQPPIYTFNPDGHWSPSKAQVMNRPQTFQPSESLPSPRQLGLPSTKIIPPVVGQHYPRDESQTIYTQPQYSTHPATNLAQQGLSDRMDTTQNSAHSHHPSSAPVYTNGYSSQSLPSPTHVLPPAHQQSHDHSPHAAPQNGHEYPPYQQSQHPPRPSFFPNSRQPPPANWR